MNGTDMNDLAAVAGADAVRKSVAAAVPVHTQAPSNQISSRLSDSGALEP